ncbi:hypothetical protein FNV43_RR26537 [Rhamnella rubrinervis]|uniref:Uncharacterized protein n=1 Tax=Rhamnella rubrinervis TaxID=2594499 RepID=A0A8K0GNV4_9ROSA|nr:hypothetical protein FNV43_RR26537 [Rhamnella rubrinervis]
MVEDGMYGSNVAGVSETRMLKTQVGDDQMAGSTLPPKKKARLEQVMAEDKQEVMIVMMLNMMTPFQSFMVNISCNIQASVKSRKEL